jgi:elongation factor 4
LLEITGTISDRERKDQFLDKLQVERERGITVKAQSASMFYTHDGVMYLLNLIDTPGHVDFSYEVSRSLYACQGALLLIDASQGVEAQTLANFYLAFEQNLTIIPIINKIDLPTADPERVTAQLEHLFDIPKEGIVQASAKARIGIDTILKTIVTHIPHPKCTQSETLKAILFDSWFDEYRGVVCLIAIHNGILKKGDRVTLVQTEVSYEILELGLMHPDPVPTEALFAGQVGYIITGIKSVREARVGDTVHLAKAPVTPFPGFKPAKPVVFAGLFPVDSEEFEAVKDAIDKLTLNDASVTVEKKSSVALGLGFRCGFLGLLHMDVFKQRLEQEYGLTVIATAPSVLYNVKLEHHPDLIDVETPSEFPDSGKIEEIYEPIIKATIIVPQEYLGSVLTLCQEKRGSQKSLSYIDDQRVILTYLLPMAEVATDFYDELKSVSSGYASFDYEEAGYQPAKLVKMDILINGKPVDALSLIVHTDKAYHIGKDLAERLKNVIHRQLFEVIIQAAIGAKIIARDRVAPLRKDVTAKCYGGDITRKRKLLEKQKAGKKKMKQVGNVELPQEAFIAVLNKKN